MLAVTVHRAQGLRAADRGDTSDPYVVVFLEGSEDQRQQTERREKTLRPEWDTDLELLAGADVVEVDAVGDAAELHRAERVDVGHGAAKRPRYRARWRHGDVQVF